MYAYIYNSSIRIVFSNSFIIFSSQITSQRSKLKCLGTVGVEMRSMKADSYRIWRTRNFYIYWFRNQCLCCLRTLYVACGGIIRVSSLVYKWWRKIVEETIYWMLVSYVKTISIENWSLAVLWIKWIRHCFIDGLTWKIWRA